MNTETVNEQWRGIIDGFQNFNFLPTTENWSLFLIMLVLGICWFFFVCVYYQKHEQEFLEKIKRTRNYFVGGHIAFAISWFLPEPIIRAIIGLYIYFQILFLVPLIAAKCRVEWKKYKLIADLTWSPLFWKDFTTTLAAAMIVFCPATFGLSFLSDKVPLPVANMTEVVSVAFYWSLFFWAQLYLLYDISKVWDIAFIILGVVCFLIHRSQPAPDWLTWAFVNNGIVFLILWPLPFQKLINSHKFQTAAAIVLAAAIFFYLGFFNQ